MYSSYLLNYVVSGLKASPRTLAELLKGHDESSPIWDVRLEADRFSLREVVAHLADWEPIWVERMTRILHEDVPKIKSIDEGELAVLHDYANTSPTESLRKYREGREKVVAFFASLKPEDWYRTGDREGVGPMSLFEMAAMITGHDGYHAIQALDCLSAQRG